MNPSGPQALLWKKCQSLVINLVKFFPFFHKK
ncbi:hypothetical protein YTXLTZUM_CDS0129 [Enterococcus phage VRE9_3]